MAIKKTYPVKTSVEIDGKTSRKKVGEAEYWEFSTIQEAIDTLGNGDAAAGNTIVLGLINTQHKTNEMNAIRAKFSTGPTKDQLRAQAMAELTTTRLTDLTAVAGDAAKIEALLESIMAEKKAAFESERNARLAALPSGDDDSDD